MFREEESARERGLSFYCDTPLDVLQGVVAQIEVVRIG
jgi:hypothetical protein